MKKLFNKRIIRKVIAGSMALFVFVASTLVYIPNFTPVAEAAINKQINYQGKLADSAGDVVADGTYAMEFKLYTASSGGSAIWTESLTGANEVQVTDGLFSVMLGAVTALTSVDFNQTLYLGVNIESDGEMTPRKIIGAVPSAFVADTLDGLDSTQFLRADTGSATIGYFVATSTTASTLPYASSTAITVSGTASTSNLVVSNTSTLNTVTANSLTASSVTIGSLNGPLQANNGVVSATTSVGVIYGGTGLNSIASSSLLIGGPNNTFIGIATSSLGLLGSADLNGYLTLANWYSTTTDQLTQGAINKYYSTLLFASDLAGTTTDALDEGLNNLYWTNNRFDTRLSATTTLPNLTTLLGLTDLIATRATTTNATTTSLYISGQISGAGLTTSCSGSGDKLIWNATTRQFACGADAGAGGGLTALGAQYSAFQSGSSQTFATSSDANILLTITSAGDVHTFTPSWTGTLSVARGGTGQSSFGQGWLAINDSGAFVSSTSPTVNYITATSTATSTFAGSIAVTEANATSTFAGGIDLSDGCFAVDGVCLGGSSYSDSNTNAYIHASSTIPKTYTANTFTGTNAFAGLTASSFNLGSGLANMLAGFDASGNLTSTSSPQVAYINATSTTATSTFAGGLSVAGTSGLTVLQNGNVGIGTTITDGKLHVMNGSAGSVTANINSNTIVMESSGNSGFSLLTPDANFGTIYFGSPSDNFGAQIAWSHNDGNLYLSTENANDDILFRTGAGANAMKLYDNAGLSLGASYAATTPPSSGLIVQGNVGIGTTSPYAKLSVVGEVVGAYFTATTSTASTFPYASTTALTVSGSTYLSGLSTGGVGIGAGGLLYSYATSTWTFASSTLLADSNTFSGNQTFNGNVTIDTLNGPLQANNGVVSATSSVGVIYGGTGLNSIASSSLLIGGPNNTFIGIATSSLGLVGSADLNSYLSLANWFATTTDVLDEGVNNFYWTNNRFDTRLSATTTLPNLTTLLGLTDLIATRATTTNATTTSLYISGPISGAGLTSCSGSSDKLIWNATTRQFACGADAGAGGGLTALGAQYSAFQSGSSQTFATSSDANILLTITSAGDVHTFTPSWTGTLSVARGGTGLSSYTLGDVLYANGTGSLAGTSTANLKTTLGLNNVENTALSAWTGSTNIATLGNITSGTWNGTTIAVNKGGTGQTSFGQGWLAINDSGAFVSSTSPTVNYITATSTATSTFAGSIAVTEANATSTFAGGIDLSDGCFAVDGVCLGGSSYGDSNTNAYIHASSTIPKTYTANTFTGANTFSGNFSLTGLSAGGVAVNSSGLLYNYATSTWTFASSTLLGDSNTFSGNQTFNGSNIFGGANTFNSTVTIGSLNGPLQANNGVVSATSSIGVLYGGTGWSAIQASAIPYGNGTGALATTTAGTAGYVLAYLNGIPTWTATSSINNGISSLAQTYGSAQTGAITLATSTATSFNGLSISNAITNSGTIFTIAPPTITGTLTVAGGGTGLSSYTLGDVLYANGTGSLAGTSTANLKTTLGLNNVENTALSAWTGSTNIATLGNITSGTWNGTTIAVNKGGTGQTSFGQGWLAINDSGAFVSSTSPTVNYITATSTATSTFAGSIAVTEANATSTFAGGIDLSDGCFAVDGVCLGGSSYGDSNTNAYIHASSTIPKTYTANTFTGTNAFAGLTASSFNLGAGLANMLAGFDASGNLTSTSSPQVAYINATSTTATSTFSGGISGPGNFTVQSSSGNVGIGLSNPTYGLQVAGSNPIFAVGGTGSEVLKVDATNLLLQFGDTWGAAENTLFTIDANGNDKFTFMNGNVGIGTTSPHAKLTVNGDAYFAGNITATSTATSTFAGSIAVTEANATSTFAGGIDLSDGCFAVDGVCLSSGGGGTVTSVTAGSGLSGGTITTTGTIDLDLTSANIWTGLQRFTNASSTRLSVFDTAYFGGTATSTFNSAGVLTLASALAVTSGGTGWANINSGYIPFGNGASALATSSSFYWDNTNARLGIGTSSPYAKLSVAGEVVASHFTATSTTATSTFAGSFNVGNGSILYDATTGTTSISYLEAGNMTFAADSGVISWIDMPVTSASVNGVVNSYSANLNGNSLLTIYGISDGSGGVTNTAVGVGTTSPNWKLSVAGIGSFDNYVRASYFTSTSTTASTFPYASTTAITVSGSTYLTGLSAGGVAVNSSGLLYNYATSTWTFASSTLLSDSNTFSGTNIFAGLTATSFNLGAGKAHMLAGFDASGNLTSTSSPQVAYINATSTTATSTFAGGLTVDGTTLVVDHSTGYVGVGTGSPGNKLVVSGGNTTNGIRLISTAINASGFDLRPNQGDDTHGFGIYDNNASLYRLSIDGSGNVGIGTTTPAYNLEVGSGSGNEFMRVNGGNSASSDGAVYLVGNKGTNVGGFGNASAYFGGAYDNTMSLFGLNGLKFYTNSLQRVAIDSSGNLGIGTTSPYAKLSVSGFTTGTPGIVADALSGFTGNLLDLKVASSTKFSIDQTGAITSAGFSGAGGVAVNSSGLLYNYATSTWTFASSTLLADSNTFSGNNTFSNTITGSITGNAGTATILQTARNINGTSFNGSADITITAASSTLLANSNTWTGTNAFAGLTATSFNLGAGLANMLAGFDASGNLTSTSSPQVAYINATSTTATSTFAGGLTVDGTTLVVDHSTGYVGVGTASPQTSFDVGGKLSLSSSAFNSLGTPTSIISSDLNGISGIEMRNINTGSSADFRFIISDTSSHYLGFLVPSVNNTTAFFGAARNTSDYLLNNGGTSRNLTIGTFQANDLIFGTSNAENMRIKSGGNVGIGTTSPSSKLYIEDTTAPKLTISSGSNTSYDPTLELLRGTGTSVGSKIYLDNNVGKLYIDNLFDSADGDILFRTRTIGTAVGALTIKGSGSVGIGTTTPTSLLQVAGATAPKITLSDTDASTDQKHWFIESNTGDFSIGTTSDALATNSTFRALTIDTTGSVGINTASPNTSYGLTVKNRGTSGGLFLDTLATSQQVNVDFGSAGSAKWSFYKQTDDDFSIYSYGAVKDALTVKTATGYVGILNGSASYPLDVAGFINTDQYSGYKQGGTTILYATTSSNIFVGQEAGALVTSGSLDSNSALGYRAMYNASSTGADKNVALGYEALKNNNAQQNVAVGYQSMLNNYTGAFNVALGASSLGANITGSNNVAIGYQALLNTNVSDTIAIGNGALGALTTGTDHTAIGYQASNDVVSANSSTALGSSALRYTTGGLNTAVGVTAGQGVNATSDFTSSALFGYASGLRLTTGDGTAAFGYTSGDDITSGNYNICFGTFSCNGLTSGSTNIGIGYNVQFVDNTASGQMNIGSAIFGQNYTGDSATEDANAETGIGENEPLARLHVKGGTAGTPVFIIEGATSQSGDYLQINASSTAVTGGDIFSIESGGNVGIGTTTPYAKLSVVGQVVGAYFTATTSTASIFPYASTTMLSATTASTTNLIISSAGGSGTRCLQVGADGTVSANALACGSGSGTFSWTPTTNYGALTNATGTPIWFQAGLQASSTSHLTYASTTAITVAGNAYFPGSGIWNSSGNVGIGTTSPYAKLSVVGEVVAPYYTATSTTATSTFAGGLNVGSGNFVYDLSTGVTSVSSLNTGNLSFDTDAGLVSWVDLPLSSASNGSVQGYTASLNGSSTISVYGVSAGSGWLQATYPRVGIASSTPWKTFSVNGTAAFSGLTAAGASGDALCLSSSKEMVVNTGAQTCTVSSARFKDNISSLSTGLDTVMKLNPVSFTYKGVAIDPLAASSTNGHLGFVAEEVFDIEPRLVFLGDDQLPRGVRYEEVTAVLAKAIQEQQVQIGGLASSTALISTTSAALAIDTAAAVSGIDQLKLNFASTSQSTKTLAKAIDTTNQSLADLATYIDGFATSTSALDARLSATEAQLLTMTASTTLAEAFASSTWANVPSSVISMIASSTAELIASSTVEILASSSPSFITRVAQAVKEIIEEAGDWALAKVTATLAVFNRVETQTAAVSQGLEMTDQVTGDKYCVTIKNGDWDKKMGACGVATQTQTASVPTPAPTPATAPAQVPVANNNATPAVAPTPVDTATSSSATAPVTEEPTPSPTPTSAPVDEGSAPVTTPESAPAPESVPTPETAPASTPASTPTPTPEPAPAPTPAPEPAPAPAPEPATVVTATE